MDSAKAVHFFNLAHFNAFNPLSTKHAIVSDHHAYENGYNLPLGCSHCDRCGIYQVPGLTSSARVSFTKSEKNRVKKSAKNQVKKSEQNQVKKADSVSSQIPRRRCLKITCFTCGYVKTHYTLINKKPVVMLSSEPTNEASKPGKKKKKSKRSELSALLEQKRAQSASPTSLSLMEFLK